MKSNNLDTMENSLRSMAKRYENVKYSLGLAILFLMKGTSAFSDDNPIQEAERKKDILTDVKKEKEEIKEKEAVKQANQKLKASWANVQFGANDMYSNYFSTPKTKVEKDTIVKSAKTILVASADNSTSLPTLAKLQSDIEEPQDLTTKINTSKENIKNSVGSLQDKIDAARKENDKEVKGLRLELVQLMEQGNQVVKSPWSSWQFGANYMHNEWNGTYKGRGDKKLTEGFARDTSKNLDKYLAKLPNGKEFKYASTDLVMVEEPEVEIEVSAGINPKIVEKKVVSYKPEAPAGVLPPFQPKLISPPKKPEELEVSEPATFDPPAIRFKGKGFAQYSDIGMPRLTGHNVVIQNYDSYDTVSMTDGKTKGVFNIEVGNLGDNVKVKWWGSNLDGTKNSDIRLKAVTNVPNTATPGLTNGGKNPGGAGTFYLDDGEVKSGMYAFINELRDHDATISGNYILTNKGEKTPEVIEYF